MNTSYIKELAYNLNLFNIAKGRIELKNTRKSNLDFLQDILQEEVNLRKAARIKANKKSSKLPNVKFKKTEIREAVRWQYKKLIKLDFLKEHENVFIVGECATGKTALASEIGAIAIEESYKVSYLKFSDYINIVNGYTTNAKSSGKFKELKNSELIIIDDFFYINVKDADLEILYNSLTFLNEERSLILITNRKIDTLKNAGSDTHLLNTLINRLLSNTHIVAL